MIQYAPSLYNPRRQPVVKRGYAKSFSAELLACLLYVRIEMILRYLNKQPTGIGYIFIVLVNDAHISVVFVAVECIQKNIVSAISVTKKSVRYEAAAKASFRILQGSYELIQTKTNIWLDTILPESVYRLLMHIIACFQENK